MIGFIIVILFALSFPCEGQINLPPGGDQLVVEPGDNATIAWTFDNTESQVFSRVWTFTRSSRNSTTETIASISRNKEPEIEKNISLARVELKTPATLSLRKVDHSYDGTYEFTIVGGGDAGSSSVRLFVAMNSTVTHNCSSFITVDVGDDVNCLCEAQDENPPVTMNVTWYKGIDQIGPTKDEKNMLSLSNVNETTNGTYICKAKGKYNLTGESNSTVVEVRPNVKPKVTRFTTNLTTLTEAVLGQPVTITCVASGRPKPTFTIKHNGKKVNNQKVNTYTIVDVKDNDIGLYECIAENILGNSSESFNLTVRVPPTPTTTTTKSTDTSGSNTGTTSTPTPSVGPPPTKSDGPSPGLIAGIIIGVLLLLLIIVFLLWWFKYRKEKSSGEHIGNDVNPGNQGSAPVVNENAYESLADGEGKKPENLYDEARLGNDNGGSGSTSDTLPPVYATADKDKDKKKNKKKDKKKDEPAPANTPPVYATVDKTRHNEPSVTYATLDTVAMQPTGSSKRDRRDQPTEYASIAEFGVKGDLV